MIQKAIKNQIVISTLLLIFPSVHLNFFHIPFFNNFKSPYPSNAPIRLVIKSSMSVNRKVNICILSIMQDKPKENMAIDFTLNVSSPQIIGSKIPIGTKSKIFNISFLTYETVSENISTKGIKLKE